MKPELVRFSSHPHPFHLEVIRCHALDCECTDVAFNFREGAQDARAGEKPLTFAVRMDGLEWKEIDPPPRSPRIARIVEEFLRDYPLEEREAIRQFSEEKLRSARRLREYRIDPKSVARGALIPFGEILHGRPGGRISPESWFDVFDHEGERYLIDDLYCANPECRCEEAHLVFVRESAIAKAGGRSVEHDFVVTLSLGGKAKIEQCHASAKSRAKAVLSAWRAQFGSGIEELRWRYAKVKEIALRSATRRTSVPGRTGFLAPEGIPAAEPLATRDRVGRNEPCPCGSGKKFKKCCGLTKAGQTSELI